MKMKFVRDLKTDRRELLVASQRGETLSTKQAEKLAVTASVLLINFSFEKPRANGLTTLHYDVEGLWSLRTYLAKRSLGVEELMGLLEAMQGVLDLCTSEHLHPEGLLFDPEYVFVNSQCCPRFVLLPLEGAPFQTRNSPLALLQALGNTDSLRFETPDAEGLSRRLGDLVVDLEGVFSANRFRRFLEQEQSLDDDTPPEARNSVVEPGTSSVWASVGGGNSSSAPDAGAFFWNPLAGLAEEVHEVEDAAELLVPSVLHLLEADFHCLMDEFGPVQTLAQIHDKPHGFDGVAGVEFAAVEAVNQIAVLAQGFDNEANLWAVEHIQDFVQAVVDGFLQESGLEQRLNFQCHIAENHGQVEGLERACTDSGLVPTPLGVIGF